MAVQRQKSNLVTKLAHVKYTTETKSSSSFYEQGIAAEKNNDFYKALTLFEQALQKDENNPNFLIKLAQTQLKLGMINESMESYKKLREVSAMPTGCECYEIHKHIEESSFVSSDNVFIGQPIKISLNGNRVTFKILKEFKNTPNTEIDLEVEGISDCGYYFELNKQYLVVASDNIVEGCGYTKLLSEAFEDIKMINGFVEHGLNKK